MAFSVIRSDLVYSKARRKLVPKEKLKSREDGQFNEWHRACASARRMEDEGFICKVVRSIFA